MKQSIGYVALVVRDYDEAIDFYVNTLGFTLIEDTYIEAQNKRWVLVAPPGSAESRLLFARAADPCISLPSTHRTRSRGNACCPWDALRQHRQEIQCPGSTTASGSSPKSAA